MPWAGTPPAAAPEALPAPRFAPAIARRRAAPPEPAGAQSPRTAGARSWSRLLHDGPPNMLADMDLIRPISGFFLVVTGAVLCARRSCRTKHSLPPPPTSPWLGEAFLALSRLARYKRLSDPTCEDFEYHVCLHFDYYSRAGVA